MSDPQRPHQPLPPSPPKARGGRPLYWLFVLLLLAGAGYGGWRGWHWAIDTINTVSTQQDLLARLQGEVAALRAQAQDLAGRETDLSAQVRHNGTALAAVTGRIETNEQATSRLSDAIEGGRTRVHLLAVEQLLLMANDRLLLAHDSASALKALELADQRLVQLNDPHLFKVREALAQEKAALTALTLPDYTGLTLSLTELGKRVPSLPLRVHVPDRFEAPGAVAEVDPDAGAFGRIWSSVKTALSNLFALRRRTGPPARLLPPDEQVLVSQVLQLRIEGARLALLAGDTRTFQELAGMAAQWLGEYYDETDIGVKQTAAELQRMRGLSLAKDVPEISRSLALLRAQLGVPAK